MEQHKGHIDLHKVYAKLEQIEAKLDALGMLEVRKDADTVPAPKMQTTRGQVAKGMARRYERIRQMPMHLGPYYADLEHIAEWIDRTAAAKGVAPQTVGTQLLDNWFASDWGAKCDYKPSQLIKNIGSVYSPPVVKREDEPDPEKINASRLRERDLLQKLDENQAGASKPPASIGEMLKGYL